MKEFRRQWDEEVGKLYRIEEEEEKIKGQTYQHLQKGQGMILLTLYNHSE